MDILKFELEGMRIAVSTAIDTQSTELKQRVEDACNKFFQDFDIQNEVEKTAQRLVEEAIKDEIEWGIRERVSRIARKEEEKLYKLIKKEVNRVEERLNK